MKKLLCLILALTLALPLILALGENEPVRVVLWHSASGEAGEKLNEFVARFNDSVGADKGIIVEAVYQGSYSDSTGKLGSLISAENYDDLPDVMQMDATGKARYLSCEVAYTIDDAIDEFGFDTDDFLPAALGNWRMYGAQLGLPFATSTTLTYYNASILDEAPDTLYDLMDIAASYDLEGEIVFACVPNTPLLANWIGQMGGYVVDGENGSESPASYLECAEDGTLLDFLKVWKELYESGALLSRASSTDEFVAGRQLVMTASSSMIASLTERIGGSFELGVAPYLRVNDEALSGATVSGSCLVMFDHGDARRQAALELVKYLTSADVQAEFAEATGYIPSTYSAMESDGWQAFVSAKSEYNAAFLQLTETPSSMKSVAVGPAADFYYTIQDIVTAMLEDDLSPEETLGEMRSELNALLDRYLKANS